MGCDNCFSVNIHVLLWRTTRLNPGTFIIYYIYMNDSFKSSDVMFSISFVDDISVFIDYSFDYICKNLNLVKHKKNSHCKENSIYYILSKKKTTKSHTNKYIDRTNNTKFIGIHIDSKLKMSVHIIYIKNLILKSNGIIDEIRKFMEKLIYRNMHFSFIYPYLMANCTYLNPLSKIQKRSSL